METMKTADRTIVTIAGLVSLAMFNLTFIVPSLKEVIIDRYDSTALIASLFVTVEMVAYIVFGVVWGVLSDRSGKRRTFIVVGFLGSSVFYYAMSLAPDIPTLMALRFAQGSMTVMAWSLLMTLALDVAHARDYGAAMGIVGTGLALGIGLGAPIGGLVGDIGPLYPLYVASAAFLVAAVLTLLLIEDMPITSRPESVMTAAKSIVRDRRVLPPFLFGFAERFSAGYLVVLLPLFLAYESGAEPSTRGLYLAAFLLPFALLQYPFGRLSDRGGRARILAVCGLAYAAAFAALGYTSGTGMLVLMAFSGALAAMLLPASLGMLGDIARKGEHATYMGGFNALGSLGFAVAPPLAATLSGWVGYPAAFAAGGVIIGATVALSLPFLMTAGRGGTRGDGPRGRGKPL